MPGSPSPGCGITNYMLRVSCIESEKVCESEQGGGDLNSRLNWKQFEVPAISESSWGDGAKN